jgi:hypothetical protein
LATLFRLRQAFLNPDLLRLSGMMDGLIAGKKNYARHRAERKNNEIKRRKDKNEITKELLKRNR